MAKKSGLDKLIGFVAWLTGLIVALSVGFALINGTLGLPVWLAGATILPVVAGWVVVVTSITGALLAIVNKFI